jgi:hypothetical protein
MSESRYLIFLSEYTIIKYRNGIFNFPDDFSKYSEYHYFSRGCGNYLYSYFIQDKN